MITFIDNVNGNAFDANDPYVFWFEDGQSVNLNYVKQICIYSDCNKLTLKVDSPVFSVLQMDQYMPDSQRHPRTVMNKKRYIDLTDLKANSFTCEGYAYHNNFVYLFYILAQSKDEGEFLDDFIIEETGVLSDVKPTHIYHIGADFYNINEVLQSNLENLEIKLPESIQKAIYESDLHEEANDNILLNRKHKELLMNYWDIVANKGSYESLSNSLKWFEWGELVRIEELWKAHERQGDIFKLEEFKTQITDELQSKMSTLSKTTFIGLYCAMQHNEHTTEGDTVYEDTYNRDPNKITSRIHVGNRISSMGSGYQINGLGGKNPNVIQTSTMNINNAVYRRPGSKVLNEVYNEEVPNLIPILAKWNNLDMCLKMTLLGNFYQTFFMPIHMDLIHSTIESWVYTGTLKLLHNGSLTRYDYVDSTRTFDLRADESDNKIKAHHTFTYSDTLFKCDYIYNNSAETRSDTNIRGVDLKARPSKFSDPDLIVAENTNRLREMYDAECGIIHFIGCVRSGSDIYKETLRWSKNGAPIELDQYIEDNTILHADADGNVDLDFNLRFLESGHYDLHFTLMNLSSIIYTKSISVDVDDDYRNVISTYRVTPRDVSGMDITDLTKDIQLRGLTFQISDRPNLPEHYAHESIFVGDTKKLSLTHFVVTPLRHGGVISVYNNELPLSLWEDNFESFGGSLSNDYWVYKENRRIVSTDFEGDVTTIDPEPFLICISKHLYSDFSKTSALKIKAGSYDADYKQGYIDELRFSPIFYKLEPFTDIVLNHGEVLYITPTILHSKEVTQGHWEFKNMTTLDSAESRLVHQRDVPDSKYQGHFDVVLPGGKQTTLFTGYTSKKLSKGYYNIILHYLEGEIQQKIELDSAFILQ